ncbi:MAG: 5-(carboxyamino)imidazole ribonucleotide synthase [Gemmatimonadota bacterium]|nr:5-(carboxyamino)imidazole ribonucleotide synthase [Gemmatimonadota bacterium]
MTHAILPGATLGVLGGGQLGRMFAMAAKRMGYRVAVLAPVDGGPTAQLADDVITAPYDDVDAVERFARSVDVVTFEFENVPAAAAASALRHAPVRPSGNVLAATQNRLAERELLDGLGLPCAPHASVRTAAELTAAEEHVGVPGVLKSASSGYDGKGQRKVDRPGELATAWDALGRPPCLYEAFIPFVAELSVVGARGRDGALALYEPARNEHVNHILDVSVVPCGFDVPVRKRARDLAAAVFEGLELVGVACVEMFLLDDGSLFVNEIAPRPHNSGHLTIEAHATSQFEAQVRAVCGLPLGSPERICGAAAMANLLGDLWNEGSPDWATGLAEKAVRLHLYGKGEARPGRKMGHLTTTAATAAEAEARVRAARSALIGR